MTFALLATLATLLDWLFGEPRRIHPLVGFGNLANALENRIYGAKNTSPSIRKIRGSIATIMLVLPLTALSIALSTLPDVGPAVSVLLLYLAIGHKSLHDHAKPVVKALHEGDPQTARKLASRMVSRDPATLNITVATTESVLENGSDSVFATLFWFAIAGIPGAVLHRLVNTLDAMWGYRNQRYENFGWAAARLDDLFNYIPARLTALTYALLVIDYSTLLAKTRPRVALSRCKQALDCWRIQAMHWESPNAGPVMAAGAGALGIGIGGPACYRGEWQPRTKLGSGPIPTADDISRALTLVRHGVILWLILFFIIGALFTLSA